MIALFLRLSSGIGMQRNRLDKRNAIQMYIQSHPKNFSESRKKERTTEPSYFFPATSLRRHGVDQELSVGHFSRRVQCERHPSPYINGQHQNSDFNAHLMLTAVCPSGLHAGGEVWRSIDHSVYKLRHRSVEIRKAVIQCVRNAP